MKIVYCHCSVYNPGGMERVLLNKVRWFRENLGWEVVIVTTDQQERPPFYEFPEGVRFYDLGINYSLDNTLPVLKRISSYLSKRKLHRSRLTEVLMKERPDITVSLYPSESSFIPDIQDGSKKVLELHFNRYFRLQYNRKGLLGMIDRFRCRQDVRIVSRFDRFVVLTEEDRGYWGNMANMTVIPNAALPMPVMSDCSVKRVIAVGRLDYQKGFDRLVDIWEKVCAYEQSDGWRLDIFGQGEWKDLLLRKIEEKGLSGRMAVNSPTSDIAFEYAASSILVMTSYYEGFPMVMIEGMSAGLPVVTFDYKCGPQDIITPGVDGVVVKNGDTESFAFEMLRLMADPESIRRMSRNAMSVTAAYSEDSVMKLWTSLFQNIIKE